MNFFRRLFGMDRSSMNSSNSEGGDQVKSFGELAFEALGDQWLGIAHERQRLFQEFIASEPNWVVDPETWTLRFGDLSFEVGPIGAFDPARGWVWAWYNRPPGVNDETVREALALRAEGERLGIPGFLAPALPTSIELVRQLGWISSGLSGQPFFVTSDSYGGGMLLSVRGTNLENLGQPDAITGQAVILAALQSEDWVDLIRMARSYLLARGYSIVETEHGMCASHSTGGTVVVDFNGKEVNVTGSSIPGH